MPWNSQPDHTSNLPECSQLNVLVAEDNPLYRKLLRFLLEDRGYKVHTVFNGRQAVDWFRREDVDLIIMGVHLPTMDGVEATAAIRRLEEASGQRVPIIGATDTPSTPDRDRCRQAGMDGYITKPLYPSELFTVLDKALGVEPATIPQSSVDELAGFSRLGDANLAIELEDDSAENSSKKRTRVLLADDDDGIRYMLACHLQDWGYDVVEACDGLEAWRVLQQPDAPLLALLDHMMPGMDGFEICQEVRKRSHGPYQYLILCTSQGSKADIVQGMVAGADDYVIKPIHPGELQARLQAGCRVLAAQKELLYARDIFRLQATLDPLTGVLNRRSLLDLLHRELARQDRQQTSMSVLLIDVDHFKQINDTHGHQAGDTVLLNATRRIRTILRSYDAIGRYGGEEFIVVLPGADANGAKRLAERLLNQIAEEAILKVAGQTIWVTVSCGIASRRPFQECDVHALIAASDKAMYRAKNSGRNCIRIATDMDYPVLASPVTAQGVERRQPR